MTYKNSHVWNVEYRVNVLGCVSICNLAQITYNAGTKPYIGILMGGKHYDVDLESLKEYRDCLNYAVETIEANNKHK